MSRPPDLPPRIRRGISSITLAGLVSSCASSEVGLRDDSLDGSDSNPADEDASDTGVEDGPDAIRLVVEPASESSAEGLLLPHTFGPYTVARDITVVMRPAVTLSGEASGFVPEPWPGVLPGATVPLDGDLRLFNPGTRREWEAPIVDGVFSLDVPPGSWTAHVYPDAALVPSWREGIDLTASLDIGLEAPDGLPVWGRVTDGIGLPVPGITVRIQTPEGRAGARTTTDDDGWYELRAMPGPTTVEALPPDGTRLPRLHTALNVDVEQGGRADLAWSNTGTVALSARLLDDDDAPVDAVVVSLSSDRLDGYGAGNASWSVEVTSDSRGFVDARVPPGAWRMEIAPDEDRRLTARGFDGVSVPDDVDLGDLRVPGFVAGAVLVEEAPGRPLVDANVSCRERIGQQRPFIGRTGQDGVARVALPQASLDCLVTPPPGRTDLAPRRRVLDPTAGVTITLVEGEALVGEVLVESAGTRRAEALAVVRVLDEDDRLLAQTVSGEDGRFAVRIDAANDPDGP